MKLKQIKESQPQVGDIRKVSGFALLPTIVDENTRVWFEKYERSEIYIKPMNGPGFITFPFWAVLDTKTDKYLMPEIDTSFNFKSEHWRDAHPAAPGPPPAMRVSNSNNIGV